MELFLHGQASPLILHLVEPRPREGMGSLQGHTAGQWLTPFLYDKAGESSAPWDFVPEKHDFDPVIL